MWVTGADQLPCEIVLVAGTPVVRLRLFAGGIVFVIGIVTAVLCNELSDKVALIADMTLLMARQLWVVYLGD